jgi:DNA polymerase III epsilon subunit-like protein
MKSKNASVLICKNANIYKLRKKLKMHTARFVIDIEASGLGPGSFPIEVAAHEVGNERRSSTWLIRPEAGWSRRSWDETAEDLHGISYDTLCVKGVPARDVCSALRAFIGEAKLFSDAHFADQTWLAKLYEAEWPPQRGMTISSIQTAVPLDQRAALNDALEMLDRPHNALEDARIIAEVLERYSG